MTKSGRILFIIIFYHIGFTKFVERASPNEPDTFNARSFVESSSHV